MCGIFGYIGKKNAVKTALAGLKKLEYRGYDSAGIAGVRDGRILYCKEVGKVSALEKEIEKANLELELAISQVRWATHGSVTKVNAHPHLDEKHSLALIHNGIIENHEALRHSLVKQGVKFLSNTDTEVIAHLISSLYEGDILKAVQKAVPLLKGAFAVALVHQNHPDQIIAFAHECPLVVGIGSNEAFLSSDSNAFAAHTREVVFLANTEIAIIKAGNVEVFDALLGQIDKKSEMLSMAAADVSKGNFEHFTLKEIHDQPQSIRNALVARFIEDYGTAIFEGLDLDHNELLQVERILILACGTSWHAGYVAAYMLEDKARIPTQVEIASEFRYKNPIVPKGTFVIAISQSGETADTLAAIKELKAKGVRVLAICNVQGSTLTREADNTLFLHAGPEMGVCSTKAFTSQVVVLALFTLMMARMRHMGKQEGQEFLECLKRLPEDVQHVLKQENDIKKIAKKYAKAESFFFVGRRYMYPTSLEGALKLKEISYINANGYAAGELKHGPIALINEKCPTVAFCANKMTFDKLKSNLSEIKVRQGPIIAILEQGQESLDGIVDDKIVVPKTSDELAVIPSIVAAQLLAYYIAKERGAEIDQPRNLAKSVTVE